ncbi:hypothetical protein ACQPZ8_16365 [Actinomadura nitritigenes]|uniref:hypothetical protein n=1 Tax=Actinomadura nitritigenes TaxID=134602 RepID=UPI003D9340F3
MSDNAIVAIVVREHGEGTVELPTTVIKAEFATFADAERVFREALRQYERILDTLSVQLAKSLAEWDGDGRRAYEAAHAR